VEVIGANCSVGPQRLIEVLERMEAQGERKLSAMPNAGFPRMIDGRYLYFSSPEYFAECTEKFLRAGAWVLGGCCGTTPAHIAAMAEVLRRVNGMTPVAVRVEPAPAEKIEIPSPPRVPSLFAQKAGREFTVSVELDPPKGVSTQKILEGARLLKENGIQVVNIADSPMARVRMSCIALAILALRIGLDVVLHFTCRDRNLMGLQSDLLGAHALGIRNVLALTGDPPSVGDYPGVTAVYDADSVGLVGILSSLNQGKDIAGNSIGQPTSFFIGAALNGNAPDLQAETDKVKRKRDNGANFLFTQPVYQAEGLERLLDLIQAVRLPVFVGILPLMSSKQAEYLHNEVPGMAIPQAVRDRLRAAGDGAAKEGIALAQEMLLAARKLASGAYLLPSFGRYETIVEVVKVLK
jgi:homocysteine S-methyltransferase